MTPGRTFLFGDYNQAESRVVAWKGPVPKLKQWYAEGVDVHTYVCRLIARVIQENKILTPKELFLGKSHGEYGSGDEERELAKRTVHAYNYGMGAAKFGLIVKLPETFAKTLLGIYANLFPEIKANYHAWVESCIRRTRTIWMPEPVRFRKVFYDQFDDELLRSAYSCYPQCTVGAMLGRTIRICGTIFKNDLDECLKDQWCAWYGAENWDRWRLLRDRGDQSPQAVRWGGMDIRLDVHDAGGISIPQDEDLIRWAALTWKHVAETPIRVHNNEWMVIPVDFKRGRSWGAEDLTKYVPDAAPRQAPAA